MVGYAEIVVNIVIIYILIDVIVTGKGNGCSSMFLFDALMMLNGYLGK